MTRHDQTALPLPVQDPPEPMPGYVAQAVLTGSMYFGTITSRREVLELHRARMSLISGGDPGFADHVQTLDRARDALLRELQERRQYLPR